MLIRRNPLRWMMALVVCLSLGVGGITREPRSWVSHAQEPTQTIQERTMEQWMKEWMNLSKAPSGMLRLSRFRDPIYFLTAPISWKPNLGQEAYAAVTVPKGFVTDLTSIPRIFWNLLRPDGEYAYAAIIHDYLYWTQTVSRKEADQILKLAMEDFEIDVITIGAIYGAVRAGGYVAWKGNAQKKIQGEKRVLTRFPQDPRTRWEDWKKRPDVFTSTSKGFRKHKG